MFKTFTAGIVLGLLAAGAALHFIPAVDQFREHSLIVVQANQGNSESFHVNVPIDRIMVGAQGLSNPVPTGLAWPREEQFADARVELFKLRNGKDTVIGIASRISASHSESGDLIEWVLHLPARGSAYVGMQPDALQGGYRAGQLMSGTREFAELRGPVTERWVADESASDAAGVGRIEINTAFVSTELDDE
ncbi:MAG: hypothetical protein OEM51_04770 [Gammaproteobacteria bacterium]|nr:hypothetical protein [Gammaproteobacteria bacterium]MDH3430176.1 hypothetical protein [Gammaproteobacteria bacterium]